jgi:DNA topoisomerase-3
MITKKKLIICEKPSVALEFSKCLKLNVKNDGFYEGDNYVVTWCIGHLCALKNPKDYDEKLEKWVFYSLPIIPKKYEIKYIEKTKKQYYIVKKLLNSEKFKLVINACDAGREGELIFQNVYKLSGSDLDIFRMWTSAAITNETINRELANLKPMSQFQGLANAARARSCADWAIGINGTRALTLSSNIYKEVISIGRVQTPTLTFLVDRELEIKNFKQKIFYQIKADLVKDALGFSSIHEYFDPEKNEVDNKFHSIEIAKKIISRIDSCKIAVVLDVIETRKKILPPLLFSLTEIQKEANKSFSFSAQKTLEIAQSLYEKHKLISYPRTDSACLPNDMLSMVKDLFVFVGEYFQSMKKYSELIIKENKFKCNRRIFDDSKVSDHHALIPTGLKNRAELSEDELIIFEMICKRFIASFLDDYIELNKKIIFNIKDVLFRTNGKTPLLMGWKDAYNLNENENDDKPSIDIYQNIPNLMKGEVVSIKKIFLDEGKTKPPQRYTEASLLSAMESPSKFLNRDQIEEKEILKEKGLGTPATRAAIIDSIIERKYCVRKAKSLVPTTKAIALIQNLKPESLKSPIITAQWEQKLAAIERNEYSLKDFSDDLNDYVYEIIDKSIECGKMIKSQFEKGN